MVISKKLTPKANPLKAENSKFLYKAIFSLLFFSFVFIQPAFAEDIKADQAALNMLNNTAIKANIISKADTAPTAYQIIGSIINIVLGFLGVVFLVLVIFGGITWMTAGGNEENVTKAKTLVTQAAIGLAIVLFAFLLTNFVVFKIIDISTISTPTANTSSANP